MVQLALISSGKIFPSFLLHVEGAECVGGSSLSIIQDKDTMICMLSLSALYCVEDVRKGFWSQLAWMGCFSLISLSKHKRQVFSIVTPI